MMADKDVEVSEAIMSPSPVPESVFVAGHQLDSSAARRTIVYKSMVQLTVAFVFVIRRTTNQTPCM